MLLRTKLSLFCLVLFCSAVAAQDKTSIRTVANSIISDSEYGMLITVGPQGFPHARTVKFSHPDKDFTLWVATKPNTRKVKEIQANPKVHMHFTADDYKSYVVVDKFFNNYVVQV